MNTAVFTAVVWVLVSYPHGVVTYSPPLKDLQSCEFLQKSLPDNVAIHTRCVQINMAVTK